MAKVTIFNYRGKNVVWPPYVVVTPKEEVVFKVVNTAATVFFPNRRIFEKHEKAGAADGGMVIRLTLEDPPITLKVKDGARLGAYPFSVYCESGQDFAEGNSSPVMILEPPEAPRRGQTIMKK